MIIKNVDFWARNTFIKWEKRDIWEGVVSFPVFPWCATNGWWDGPVRVSQEGAGESRVRGTEGYAEFLIQGDHPTSLFAAQAQAHGRSSEQFLLLESLILVHYPNEK